MWGRRLVAVALVLSAGACGGEDAPGDGAAPVPEAPPVPQEGVFGRAPSAVGGIPAVVLMYPVSPGAEAGSGAVPAGDAGVGRPAPLIDQFGLTFSPALLVVDVGTPITFTNSEGALTHNVHLRSIDREESVFDEDANSGDAIRATLTEPGGYDVLCDMHPGMSAFVFATDTPYAVFADADGTFQFGRVPPGTYAIRTWTRDVGYGPEDTVSVTGTFTEVDLAGLR